MSFLKGEIVKPSLEFQTSLGMVIAYIELAEVKETFFARTTRKQVLKIKVLKASRCSTIKNSWFESVDSGVYGPKHNATRKQPYRCKTGSTIYVYASSMCKAEQHNVDLQEQSDPPTQTEFQKLAGYTPMSLNKDIHTILILD